MNAETIIADLESDYPEKAYEALQQHGSELLDELLILAKQEADKWRKAGEAWLLWSSFPPCMLMVFLRSGLHQSWFVAGPAGLILAVVWNRFYSQRLAAPLKLKYVVRTLAHVDDVRTVGPLIEGLMLADKTTSFLAAPALVRLLPKLKAADEDLLNEHQRRYMNHLLMSRTKTEESDPELSLAILQALQQLGDRTALKPVRRLAQGKGKAARNRLIQEAAQASLSVLEQRLSLRVAHNEGASHERAKH